MNSTAEAIREEQSAPTGQSQDFLPWLGALVFGGLAIAWLLVSQPWASDDPVEADPVAAVAAPTPAQGSGAIAEPTDEISGDGDDGARTAVTGTLDDPVRMAQLALEAGMLLEPADYSAWALFKKAVDQDPGNPDAKAGLEDVAGALMGRAAVALEQDRISDAARLVETVLAELPEHPQAVEIAAFLPGDLVESTAVVSETRVTENVVVSKPSNVAPAKPRVARAAPPKIESKPAVVTPEPKPEVKVDLVAEALEKFEAALAAGQLLAPRSESAKAFLGSMTETAPEDSRTAAARQQLFEQFLAKAEATTVAMDVTGAEIWISEADQLNVDDAAVNGAREALDNRVIEVETSRPIPVSALQIIDYSPPRYPNRAVERGVEGWVDVEFILSRDGIPQDVEIINASHDRYFRKEAQAAVESWRFAPHEIRGKKVDQKAATRLTFKLQ